MPILKTIQLPSHAEATYWRISKIILEIEARQLQVNLGGFISKAAWQAGAMPITEIQASASGEELDTILATASGLLPAINSLITILEPLALQKVPELQGGTAG